jgi:hypothetical protein
MAELPNMGGKMESGKWKMVPGLMVWVLAAQHVYLSPAKLDRGSTS